MRVIIQPSYGQRAAQAHWRDTLDQEVDFARLPAWPGLLDEQRDQLTRLHPTGCARFWGAQAGQDHRFDAASTGDVVLFTGQKLIRAIGEMGAIFRDSAFADDLWTPDPANGSWQNVYSLLTFQPTAIPYRELQDLLGTSPKDMFMGLRVVPDDLTDAVLDGLGIITETAQRSELAELTSTWKNAVKEPGQDQLVPPEAFNTATTSWPQQAREVLARRIESALVKTWEASLPTDVSVSRIRCQGLVTDSYVSQGASHDLVEAKAGAGHHYVRNALGQLLDYSNASTSPITTLTALFPERPSNRDLALLHRYGIDCVYRLSDGTFERLPADASRRQFWLRSLNEEPASSSGAQV